MMQRRLCGGYRDTKLVNSERQGREEKERRRSKQREKEKEQRE